MHEADPRRDADLVGGAADAEVDHVLHEEHDKAPEPTGAADAQEPDEDDDGWVQA